MLKRALSFMAAILVVLTAGTGMAHSSSKWRQSPKIIEALNLSPDEINQLDDAYVASRTRMIEYKGRVDAERYKLEEMLVRPEIDEATVREQNRRMEDARSDLAAERFNFLLMSRKIIGYERFQKLTEIQRQWREARRKKWEQKESQSPSK